MLELYALAPKKGRRNFFSLSMEKKINSVNASTVHSYLDFNQ